MFFHSGSQFITEPADQEEINHDHSMIIAALSAAS